MSTHPTDTETGTDDGIAAEIREAFDVCECGRPLPKNRGGSHRAQCYVVGGITPLDETTEAEREWRREADTRAASTPVAVPPSRSKRDDVAYHEVDGCHLADADVVEETTLREAKRDGCVPCANPACRRARGDAVYGDLYDPLDG
ncbi:MAG: hypothetical protein ABEJ85_03195 [Haloarculaceae archaeon]